MWNAARRQLGATIVDNAFRTSAWLGTLHPDARPIRHGVERLRDIAYRSGGAEAHRLDVYRRVGEREPLQPVVFYVHGGGFRFMSKDTHWLMALAFARRGYVVFTVNYRLASEARYPAAIEDVCAAYAWVREHAATYGGDPARIVLAGESAGANLVAALTVALCWQRPEPYAAAAFAAGAAPRAVVPACGVFQVSDQERFMRRKPTLSRFLADRLEEVEEAYLGMGSEVGHPSLDLADPLVFLERAPASDRPLPPFFLPVGTADPLLPDTRRMAQALSALGAPAEAVYYPGEFHAFHAFAFRQGARRCWEDTFHFLDRHGAGFPEPARMPWQR